jgi:GR25 family glycosyltransferase involved in LPS biosynthesis
MRAYVINLDKDSARLARVTRDCVAAAIPCERFPAIDGRSLDPLPDHSTGSMMAQGATGCFLSHRALCRGLPYSPSPR